MNAISELKKQNVIRLSINIFIYGALGALFAYGAFHKFAGVEERAKSYLLYLILAVLFAGYALFNLFLILSKLYLREFQKSLKLYGVSEASLESDFSDSPAYHQMMFGRRNLLHSGKKSFIIPYNNVLWVYLRFHSRRYELPYCILHIFDDKGNHRRIKYSDKEYVQDIMNLLKDKAPNAYYGDNNQYYNLYSCNFEEMVNTVHKNNEI